MINDAKDLERAANEAGNLLQEISNFVDKNPQMGDFAKVAFPTGVITKAAKYREGLNFIKEDNFRKNVSYNLMIKNIFEWIIKRTTLTGQGQSMIIKEGICLSGYACESYMTVIPSECLKKGRTILEGAPSFCETMASSPRVMPRN